MTSSSLDILETWFCTNTAVTSHTEGDTLVLYPTIVHCYTPPVCEFHCTAKVIFVMRLPVFLQPASSVSTSVSGFLQFPKCLSTALRQQARGQMYKKRCMCTPNWCFLKETMGICRSFLPRALQRHFV